MLRSARTSPKACPRTPLWRTDEFSARKFSEPSSDSRGEDGGSRPPASRSSGRPEGSAAADPKSSSCRSPKEVAAAAGNRRRATFFFPAAFGLCRHHAHLHNSHAHLSNIQHHYHLRSIFTMPQQQLASISPWTSLESMIPFTTQKKAMGWERSGMIIPKTRAVQFVERRGAVEPVERTPLLVEGASSSLAARLPAPPPPCRQHGGLPFLLLIGGTVVGPSSLQAAR